MVNHITLKAQTVKDPESLSRARSIGIQLSVTKSFKTQTVKDPESLSTAMSISIQLSVTITVVSYIFAGVNFQG